MTDLVGKTVTGSTSGTGRATAVELAARGAHVLVEPEELASAIAFLASDDASFVYGSPLPSTGDASRRNAGRR